MEQSAEIDFVDYNYDSQIPYSSKILLAHLKRNTREPLSLRVGAQARIISLDHNQGQSIRSVIISDIIGSKIALIGKGENIEYIPRGSYLLW